MHNDKVMHSEMKCLQKVINDYFEGNICAFFLEEEEESK